MKKVELALDNFRLAILAVKAAMAELEKNGLNVLGIDITNSGTTAQISDHSRFAEVLPAHKKLPFNCDNYPYKLEMEFFGIKFITLCPTEQEVKVDEVD